jgi:D-alanine-D-alanine ligase
MTENNRTLILYNKLSENALADELDVLDQVELVSNTLKDLGYPVTTLQFSFDIETAISEIKKIDPFFIFNLVESMDNKGELCFIAPAVLNYLKIPYSGVRLEGMFITTNKILTKKMLRNAGIPTADWIAMNETEKINPSKTYILKPLSEDGSLGLDYENVFKGTDIGYIERISKLSRFQYFIEEYIDGREFNISVLGGNKGPEVMPHAEMQFIDFPEDKPKIMGYSAKWSEDTFDYDSTCRTFDFIEEDIPLLKKLDAICIQCWNVLDLHGYVRVDFRIDSNNNPFVLEINANPCLSDNGGFYAASHQRGYPFTEVMKRIIEDAHKL